jgi:hypothetical protein
MRIDTFINQDGKAEIISAFLRTSLKNSHVDNWGAGGCSMHVDLESGRLGKYAYSDIIKDGVKRFTVHPLTNIVFENFSVPLIEEAKSLVLNAAHYLPGIRLVGWDVAIAENGPVIVEGNSDYDIAGSDHHADGYRNHPVFKKVLKEVNYLL